MNYQDGLRQANVGLDPLAALQSPVTILLGVTEPVREALATLGLETVLDLATSTLFGLAFEIGEAVHGRGGSMLARLDAIPGGAAAPGGPTRLVDLADADLSALRSLSAGQAGQLKAALNVETVGDLGRWIPFRSARLVLAAAGGGTPSEADEATEFVPKFGEFPTERRYYSSIVMDHVAVGETVDLTIAGPVDISPTIEADFGFSAPAVGARLTFEQSWFAHGVTLGNLLHSVALAPGESTRIAVVDWSRQTRAVGTEEIGETESLTAQTSHNRAISEVQQAVANEVQSGFSHTESTATTKESGGGLGFSMGPITLGGSSSSGTTTTSADSFSTSAGSRELAASMSQQVMDATQQAASSVRNRRASLVKEISETEHESVSTRILANYNHMHALTVQYYEVVEVYRVIVGLHEAERCLFVPMKLVDFDDRTVTRYQGALAAAALTRRARGLLTTDFGMIPVRAVLPMRPFLSDALSLSAVRTAARARTLVADTPAPAPTPIPTVFAWGVEEIRRISRITAANVMRPGGEEIQLPREASVEGVNLSLEGSGPIVTSISCRQQLGRPEVALVRTSIGWSVPGEMPLENLLEIVVVTGPGEGRAKGRLTLELSYRGAFFPVTVPIDVGPGAATAVVRVGDTESGAELVEHLRANRLHYNQAIWRSFDASTVALLLSRFTFEGQPVADLIDPRPIQIAGNYMVFRMPGFVARSSLAASVPDDGAGTPEAVAGRAWRRWLSDRGLIFGRETTTEKLVPVPTGGVFAEAVLGRSNAAEKLDFTRFWNWQDSPIPLQPPEIAAINMASRAQPVDVTPGQLGQPVLNIVNPTSLPDPTGLGPMLGALQSGTMFRDMAGLAATIGLAQGTSESATSAAADAGRLAAANLAVAAQKEIEQQKIAAQLAMAAMGNPAAMSGTPKNISEMGALLNTAEQRDKTKQAGGASPGGGGETAGGAGGFDGGGGGGGESGGGDVTSGSGGGSSGTGGGSMGDLAIRRALFGGLGMPSGDLVLATTGRGGGGSGGVSPPQFVLEIFFYSRVVKRGALSTEAGEVAALTAGTWKPGSVDFRAISIRSAGMRLPRADAEVANLDQFMKMLAQPARRFNFFGYMSSVDSLTLDGEVQPNQIRGGDPGTGVTDINAGELGLGTITALRELGGLSSGGGALGELLRAIRKRNKEFRDQASGGGRNDVLRELWLAIVDDPPAEAFAQELAKGLQMRVVIYPESIIFRPEVRAGRIEKRGIIELLGFQKEDVHEFDGDGISFDP